MLAMTWRNILMNHRRDDNNSNNNISYNRISTEFPTTEFSRISNRKQQNLLETKIFDGETKFPRIIVLKFPSYERALEWYNSEEYKPIKQIRLDNAEGTNIIIKGL